MTEVAGALTRLTEKAAELHNEMMNSQAPGYMFKQPEMQDLVRVKNVNELMRYVQELTDNVCVFGLNFGFMALRPLLTTTTASPKTLDRRQNAAFHRRLVRRCSKVSIAMIRLYLTPFLLTCLESQACLRMRPSYILISKILAVRVSGPRCCMAELICITTSSVVV